MLILEISKIVIHELCYDYIKIKIRRKNDIVLYGYRHLYSLHQNRKHLRRYSKDVEKRFDTSNFELEDLYL